MPEASTGRPNGTDARQRLPQDRDLPPESRMTWDFAERVTGIEPTISLGNSAERPVNGLKQRNMSPACQRRKAGYLTSLNNSHRSPVGSWLLNGAGQRRHLDQLICRLGAVSISLSV